jgi:endonuclease/exonuclease/phosphatase family metal-dependent hydrolase
MRRLPPAARTIALITATLLAVPSLPGTASGADAPETTAKLASPDRLSHVRGVPGPYPGSTTFRWRTSGRYTDQFRITTALTRFGGRGQPRTGRHSMTWVVDGSRRSLTLSAAQTAAAGAALGTGRHLFFRIKAVNIGGSSSLSRPYRHLVHTSVRGQGSTMGGSRLRYAEYNVRVQAADIPGHHWRSRQRAVARMIARANPTVIGVQELMPNMWTHQAGGIGLRAQLRRIGAGKYHITRSTAYFSRSGQDTRILYDSTRVRMTSSCPQTRPSCYISLPDGKHRHVAAYARFQDLASGQQFYFVSAHLSPGNNATTDALRGRQAQAMSDGIKAVDREGLPVVFASDANSGQLSAGVDAPHVALLNAGWYDTEAAAQTVNVQYNSVNAYKLPQRPSPYGFGCVYDTISTLGMPGADLFKEVLTGTPGASDHNLTYADVRLPSPNG